jgi:hypothetical protein
LPRIDAVACAAKASIHFGCLIWRNPHDTPSTSQPYLTIHDRVGSARGI